MFANLTNALCGLLETTAALTTSLVNTAVSIPVAVMKDIDEKVQKVEADRKAFKEFQQWQKENKG